ncbi:hypothetical protein PAECIP111893_00018 [Paenibacillus plantiphilus]|uniref:VWFA domain-containing protein n=1 Tax=Paenibacillus plantiphilus TaxID=2905650 RepID=A0ABM9BN78_9BACL|nr:vWA domain-containing protein [Paenibacillus plantiphilus]CAH1189920.1 hypothetical protein PAECIP111893_00018 [Paenibacillus plantiphilus]
MFNLIGINKRIAFLLSLLLLFLLLLAPAAVAAEEKRAPLPGYDAVFVLDTSYSMNDTDPDNIASEVINMFIDMTEAKRTRIGFAAYNHTIVDSMPLTPITVKEKREELKRKLDKLRRSGFTDLGLGLRKGTKLLSGASDNHKFIILLSDGETDFGPAPTGRTVSDSSQDVESAIQAASAGGYPIYTIGLNHDGTVNQEELERIAELTGGKSYMANSADDLPETFNRIFADQFQSNFVPVAAVTATGKMQEVTVTIPNSSMRETNIVLLSDHPLEETQLYYTSQNIRYTVSDKYALLKILKPEKGAFKLKFRGARGDLIKVNLLDNYDVQPRITLPAQGVIKGKPAVFHADLITPDGEKLLDKDVYKTLKIDLIITNKQTNSTEHIALKNIGDALTADYTFQKSGSYTWKARLDGPDFYRNYPVNTLDVTNTAPEQLEKGGLALAKEDGAVTLPLSDYFNDANGDALAYELVSNSAADSLGAVVQNGKLTIDPLQSGNAQLVLRATDDEGGTVTTEIAVAISNMWDGIIRIALIAIAVVIAAAVAFWKLRPRPPFKGRLEGYFLSTASGNDIPVKYWPLTSFSQQRVTLRQLFESLDIHEPLPESAHIIFKAGKDGALHITHRTRCTVSKGRSPIEAGRRETLHFNDKLYITFEDGMTEIELRYKSVKPTTNIYQKEESAS